MVAIHGRRNCLRVIDWGHLPWPSWFEASTGPFPLSCTTLHKYPTPCTFLANRCKASLQDVDSRVLTAPQPTHACIHDHCMRVDEARPSQIWSRSPGLSSRSWISSCRHCVGGGTSSALPGEGQPSRSRRGPFCNNCT